jgi:DNA processing protein
MSPRRLSRVLAHHVPDDAVERLAAGGSLDPMVGRVAPAEVVSRWRSAVRARSCAAAAEACATWGVDVVALGDPRYPDVLAVDPEAPAVLFVRGDLAALDARRVGIVGTRNATTAGRATAGELGAALAAEGVAVVSGLARGIDGAAHQGVRRSGGPGRPVAVVGNGLGRPYPKRHAELWEWVASEGVVVSEWPPEVAADAWRFPLRNRILAALSEVLVVVESRERGGSLITARAALDRSVEVMAVPGSPRSRASAGTNQLLVEGAAPVTSAADVLVMLGLDHRRQGEAVLDTRPPPDPLQTRIVELCAEQPSTLDMIVSAAGVGVLEAALATARLERAGWLVEAGGWFEPAGSRLRPP